jgi:hypothetical protein
VHVDIASLLSIDHACDGCGKNERCCCATYEVCVTKKEMDRIIEVLPAAARLCPHLKAGKGYDNVFDEVEPGVYALDTTEDGLCLFAYVSQNKLRCSLHTVAMTLGLPLGKVKPKACLLWPMNFSEGEELLSLTEDALSFRCNSRRRKASLRMCPSFVEAIEVVYGEGCGTIVEQEAAKGLRRTMLIR